jgi:hypothetical protein
MENPMENPIPLKRSSPNKVAMEMPWLDLCVLRRSWSMEGSAEAQDHGGIEWPLLLCQICTLFKASPLVVDSSGVAPNTPLIKGCKKRGNTDVKSPNLPNLVAVVYLRVEHTPNKNCQKMVLEKRQKSVETTSIGC